MPRKSAGQFFLSYFRHLRGALINLKSKSVCLGSTPGRHSQLGFCTRALGDGKYWQRTLFLGRWPTASSTIHYFLLAAWFQTWFISVHSQNTKAHF